MDTNFAPSETAAFTPVPRSLISALFASTRMMRQFGHVADTMSRSRDSSSSQPVWPAARGSGLALPSWLTLRKQPLATVHGGRWYWERYSPRSDAAFGSSKASTIATVWPRPAAAAACVRL